MTDPTPLSPAAHPITPPPQLVEQWLKERFNALPAYAIKPSEAAFHIATQAANWGFEQHIELDAAELEAKLQKARDEELEACCAWLRGNDPYEHDYHQMLRDARRPKPPSLKEQALETLAEMREGFLPDLADLSLLRRALEQLPND